MIIYLIKSTISLLILYLVYRLLLSQEKAYQFNRFFLLASLLFSLYIPLIKSPLKPHTQLVKATPTSIHFTAEELLPKDQVNTNPLPTAFEQATENVVESKQLPPIRTILLVIYFLILIVLVLRLVLHLKTLFSRIKNSQIIDQGHYKAVLSTGKDLPFTFLSFVFLEKTPFLNGQVNSQLLLHEETHARQWHSLDILFIELLKTIFWFNPVFHLYKNAIQVNHEFIADEAVVKQCADKKNYQYLLLSYARQYQQNRIVSYSKYSLTKNRIIMMNKTKNWPKTAVKLLLTVPVAIGMVSLLSMKVQSNTTEPIITQISNTSENSLIQKIDYLEEYEKILDKVITKEKRLVASKIDINHLRQLWEQMSEDQRKKARKIPAVPALLIPDKAIVSQEQLDEIINDDKIGVWLDGKQVSKNEIAKLFPEEIVYYHKSSILKNAKNYGVFDYEISLMTDNTYYQNFIIKETLFDQKYVYAKAIEIYMRHQNNPEKYKGKLGGDIDVLHKIYERIPQWEKEKYNIKTPSEAIKGENKNKGISFSYIPYFKQQKNDKC